MFLILLKLLRVYEFILLVNVILSWVIPTHERKNNVFFRFIDSATEPVLKPVRKKLIKIFPPIMQFRLDISPIIVFLALSLLEGFLKIIFI